MGKSLRLPRYVQGLIDRHGHPRHYLRAPGRARTALPGLPWSPAFMAAYDAALNGTATESAVATIGASRAQPGSLNAAVAAYLRSTAYAALAPTTQRDRRTLLDAFRAESGDGRVARGELPIAPLTAPLLQRILNRYGANRQRNMLKALRSLMAFALDAQMIEHDPTQGIRLAKVKKSGGFHTWTEEEIAQFEAHHPVGSMQRLAFALMLYTGLRRSDVVRIGPQHVKRGVLTIQPQKTAGSSGVTVAVPIHPALAAVLAATPSHHLTFIVSSVGKPYEVESFGNWMRKACNDAGLPDCSAHGLRKACGVRLAEAGASVNQIAAVLGHKDFREVMVYTEAADRRRMAREAMTLIEGKKGTGIVNPTPAGLQNRTKAQ